MGGIDTGSGMKSPIEFAYGGGLKKRYYWEEFQGKFTAFSQEEKRNYEEQCKSQN